VPDGDDALKRWSCLVFSAYTICFELEINYGAVFSIARIHELENQGMKIAVI
jgi:hypothetical protein